MQEIDPDRWGRLTLIYREYSRIPDVDVLRKNIKDTDARILGSLDASPQHILIDRQYISTASVVDYVMCGH